MSRRLGLGFVLLAACSGPVSQGEVDDGVSIEASLASARQVFVGFHARPGAAERAAVERTGASVRREFADLNAVAIEVNGANVAELARLGGVAYVEEDPIRTKLGLADAELAPSLSNGLYGLVRTQAVDAHAAGFTGSGIKVCVADTSLAYNHTDIAPRYKGGIDTVGAGDNDPINDDGETHGTHVAGTILGALNTSGVRGVAYNGSLYHARVLGPTGGTSSDIMEGVRWLVETAGCRIVNLSLGGGMKSRTEENFYKSMRAKGALVVAATGNDSATRISYPAGYAVNVAVGAVDVNNALASFSNRGKGIDLVGPGVNVLSSVPNGSGSEASVTAGGTTRVGFGLEFAGKTAGKTGTLVNCGLGNPGECPANVAGNIALIQRGTLSFAEKVTNATNQGAVAAILYNNVAGDFAGTLGAAGTWIPAITVSDAAGAALVAQVGTSATVVNVASNWEYYSGTSMATPHVAGAAAVVWGAKPSLTADQVESILKSTSLDLGTAGYDTSFGYGLVQVKAGVDKALATP